MNYLKSEIKTVISDSMKKTYQVLMNKSKDILSTLKDRKCC